MRVLVTGLSGFVGSALKPVLMQRGHEVRSLPRGDWTARHFAGGDAVVHLANVADPRTPRSVLWDVNVRGTRAAAQMAAEAGVRRFLYVSSVKAQHADDYYGRAKLEAEHAVADVSARKHMDVVVLRPPLHYGAGVRGSFYALLHAIGQGWPLPFASVQNRRSLLYVENLASAIALCVELEPARGRTYVLSDGHNLSTPELCRRLGEALGRPARLFPFPVVLLNSVPRMRALTQSLEIDDSSIRRELGWAPPISVHDAIRQTGRWYLSR